MSTDDSSISVSLVFLRFRISNDNTLVLKNGELIT